MDATEAVEGIPYSHPVYVGLDLKPGTRQIRVLDVADVALKHNDEQPLQVSLRVLDLDQPHDFTALSYVWGSSSKPSKQLTSNGVLIDATDNAYAALLHLRQKLGSFTIWIDAICINQVDDDEKAHQIALMQDIYAGASTVYVWLGPGTSESDRAMDFLSSSVFFEFFFVQGQPSQGELPRPRFWAAFSKWYINLWRLYFLLRSSKGKGSGFIHAASVGDERDGFLLTSDLTHLLSRPWIQRIWTYQEILLANNPIVVCGDRFLPWQSFSLMIVYIEYIFPIREPDFDLAVRLPTWTKVALSRERFGFRRTPQATIDMTALHAKTGDTQLMRYHSFVHKMYATQGRILSCMIVIAFVSFILAYIVFSLLYDARQTILHDFHQDQAELAAAGQPLSDAQFTSMCLEQCKTESCTSWFGVPPCIFPSYKPVIPIAAVFGSICLLMLVNTLPARMLRVRSMLRYDRQQNFRPELQDDLVDALCTRKATQSRDMAFGLRSVLEEMLQQRLPAADTSIPHLQIYRNLTLDLLRAGRSMQILLAASCHRAQGQPSWVPDWSQEFLRFWISRWSSHLNATPGSIGHYALDESNDGILVVRGRRVCSISNMHNIEATSTSYDEAERSRHIQNLGIMLRFLRRDKGPSAKFRHIDQKILLWHLYDSGSRSAADFTHFRLAAYRHFLCEHSKKPASQVLSLLLSDSKWSVPWREVVYDHYWYQIECKDLLHIHILICNNLVNTGRTFFITNDLVTLCPPHFSLLEGFLGQPRRHPKHCTKLPYNVPLLHSLEYPAARNRRERPGRIVSLGVCNNNVQIGDQVVLVAGLSTPLIIRPRGDNDTFELVSPGHVGGLMRGKGWFCTPRNGEDPPYEYFKIA